MRVVGVNRQVDFYYRRCEMKCLFESVDCEHRNTGGCSRGDCVFAPQEAKEQPADIHQQLKYAIALLEECHKALPACPAPIGAWADCGCLHCRVELFISRNSIR